MKSAVVGLRQEGYRVEMVNCGYGSRKAEKMQVYRIPTFVYFEGGKEVRRTSGGQSKKQLKKFLEGGGWF